jgi:hypothetical protein
MRFDLIKKIPLKNFLLSEGFSVCKFSLDIHFYVDGISPNSWNCDCGKSIEILNMSMGKSMGKTR